MIRKSSLFSETCYVTRKINKILKKTEKRIKMDKSVIIFVKVTKVSGIALLQLFVSRDVCWEGKIV